MLFIFAFILLNCSSVVFSNKNQNVPQIKESSEFRIIFTKRFIILSAFFLENWLKICQRSMPNKENCFQGWCQKLIYGY